MNNYCSGLIDHRAPVGSTIGKSAHRVCWYTSLDSVRRHTACNSVCRHREHDSMRRHTAHTRVPVLDEEQQRNMALMNELNEPKLAQARRSRLIDGSCGRSHSLVI